MTNEELLTMLKLNLEIATTNEARNGYLTDLIEVSKREIAREGITLVDDIDDNNLIVMYAAYLYRQRAGSYDNGNYITTAYGAKGMPQMLRYALNQRLFAPKEKTP